MVAYVVAKMPFVFTHVEYCDMHFVYGFCDGNARAAVDKYRRRFPDRRIPSRSVFTPELTLLDYYIWGHMKTLVYETKVDSREELRHRIFAAAVHIRSHPDSIASAIQSLLLRAENCIGTGGGHFEQLL